jgi:hypothetical protein
VRVVEQKSGQTPTYTSPTPNQVKPRTVSLGDAERRRQVLAVSAIGHGSDRVMILPRFSRAPCVTLPGRSIQEDNNVVALQV